MSQPQECLHKQALQTIEHLKVGNMKINMKTKVVNINSSGYNPKIQISSGLYSIKFFQETSAVRNTLSEYTKNKIIPINNLIKVK